MDDFLKKICVRITVALSENSKREGSGFLFQTNDALYTITAYHCIYGKGQVTDVKITIDRQESFNSSFNEITVLEIVEANEQEDWVLLRVEKPSDLSEIPEVGICGDFATDVPLKFRGFQAVNREHGRTFDAKVIDRPTNREFRISLKDEDRFRNGVDDAKGLSGSGAFFEFNNKIYLTGLLKKVVGDEVDKPEYIDPVSPVID